MKVLGPGLIGGVWTKRTLKQIQKLLRHWRQATTESCLHSIEASVYEVVRILSGKVVRSGTPKGHRESKKAQD